MNCKFANITKNQIQELILPFIPKNRRVFSCGFDMGYLILVADNYIYLYSFH